MALESFLYSNEVDHTTLFDQAVSLAAELVARDTDRDPEDLSRAIRGLLDAYLAVCPQEIKTLDTEREITSLFQTVYATTYKYNCDPGDIWWDDELPRDNIPRRFVILVAKIQAQRDNAGTRAFQEMAKHETWEKM